MPGRAAPRSCRPDRCRTPAPPSTGPCPASATPNGPAPPWRAYAARRTAPGRPAATARPHTAPAGCRAASPPPPAARPGSSPAGSAAPSAMRGPALHRPLPARRGSVPGSPPSRSGRPHSWRNTSRHNGPPRPRPNRSRPWRARSPRHPRSRAAAAQAPAAPAQRRARTGRARTCGSAARDRGGTRPTHPAGWRRHPLSSQGPFHHRDEPTSPRCACSPAVATYSRATKT